MLAQKLCVVFLTLALSSFTAQAAPQYHKYMGRNIFLGRAANTFAATDRQRNGGSGGGSGGTGGSTGGKNGGNTVNNTASGSNQAGSGAQGAGSNAQTSLTLDPAVIAKGFASDGQQVPTAGQVPSLTSQNNFINFCLTVNLPITNGQQLKDGSCNPAPMGAIPSTAKMPSSKFVFPKNFGAVKTNTPFTIQMAIQNIQTGNFVNPQSNYYAAPQHLNGQGQIIGHSHVVVEQLDAIDQTTLTDPNKFAFFKGVNDPATNGVVSIDVSKGLPAGVYKLSSINAAANHQPVLVAIAQHGSLDDAVYFFVTDDGQVPAGALPGAGAGAAGAGSGSGSGSAGAGSGGSNTSAGAGAGAGGSNNGATTATATGKGGAATATATGRGGRGGKGGKGGATATGKGGAATNTAAGTGAASTATATGKDGAAVTATATAGDGAATIATATAGDGAATIATAGGNDGAAATATATGRSGGGKGSNGASTSAADPAATGRGGATGGTKGGSTSSKGSFAGSGPRSGSQGRN